MIARGHYVAPVTKIGQQWHRFSRQDAGKRLSAHIKYLEHRARGENEERSDRHLFTATDAPEEGNEPGEQRITRQQALEDMMSNAGKKVYFHQFFLSCADDEQTQDGRALVRETMKEFERQRNMNLTWYAVEHNNTDHRHWHVILAGSGEDHATGERRDVVMSYKDYEFLREQAHEFTDHEFHKQLDMHLREDDAQERKDMREMAIIIAHELHTPADQVDDPPPDWDWRDEDTDWDDIGRDEDEDEEADEDARADPGIVATSKTEPRESHSTFTTIATNEVGLNLRVDWTRWVEYMANQGTKQDQENKKRNRDNDNDREDFDR